MATIGDISQALGDYMLKGWVLTDQSCPTPGCAVPLVRSPKGRTPITTICVKCNDGNPLTSRPQNNAITHSSDASTESQNSRSSTPPTEFSEVPESPVFLPLEESEDTRRRRAQSDQASSEIGKRLLKGWAMLGDECPNETCYGVPLVRPPKSGGEKDPKKECVICRNTYVSEVDWAGRETLVPYTCKSDAPTVDGISNQGSTSQIQSSSAYNLKILPGRPSHPFSSPFGREPEEKAEIRPMDSSRYPARSADLSINPKFPLSSSGMALDETSQALQASLRCLSGRLASFTSSSTTDPGSIGATADAITKVAQALGQVQQLQRM